MCGWCFVAALPVVQAIASNTLGQCKRAAKQHDVSVAGQSAEVAEEPAATVRRQHQSTLRQTHAQQQEVVITFYKDRKLGQTSAACLPPSSSPQQWTMTAMSGCRATCDTGAPLSADSCLYTRKQEVVSTSPDTPKFKLRLLQPLTSLKMATKDSIDY